MSIFVGPAGLRSGWRVAGFVVLFLLLQTIAALVMAPLARGVPSWNIAGTIVPQAMAVSELVMLAITLCCTAVFAYFERRPLFSYGFGRSGGAGRLYFEGVALGAIAFGAVGGLMYAFGGFRIDGFALEGNEWLFYPLLWLGVMLLVGFTEEFLFRGYPLYALSRGIGFWPAAIVMTLLFGMAHLTKDGENAVDIASFLFIGLFFCFTLRRTGSLWLAAGFHFAVNFMQFFVIGTRNGSAVPLGHLLESTFPGPAWVNGGALGTEASYFVFPIVAVLFLVVHLRYPKPQFAESSKAAAPAY